MGFEPMMRVLQTLALPLGHVAIPVKLAAGILTETPQLYKRKTCRIGFSVLVFKSQFWPDENKNPFFVEGVSERAMGLEPTTYSLARSRSTN